MAEMKRVDDNEEVELDEKEEEELEKPKPQLKQKEEEETKETKEKEDKKDVGILEKMEKKITQLEKALKKKTNDFVKRIENEEASIHNGNEDEKQKELIQIEYDTYSKIMGHSFIVLITVIMFCALASITIVLSNGLTWMKIKTENVIFLVLMLLGTGVIVGVIACFMLAFFVWIQKCKVRKRFTRMGWLLQNK